MAPGIRWEYLEGTPEWDDAWVFGEGKARKTLATLGNEGWELVQVLCHDDAQKEGSCNDTWIFKRPRQ